MNRFRRLGIQKRIMLYVAVGLAIVFGSFASVGLRSIQEATELVYDERLNVAYTTAGILGRDFLHVARDAREAEAGLSLSDEEALKAAAQDLLEHLANTDPFPFFRVTGVWVLSREGRVVAEVGSPASNQYDAASPAIALPGDLLASEFVVVPAIGGPVGSVPFATIVTRLADSGDWASRVVAVHTTSVNSRAPYVPSAYRYAESVAVDPGASLHNPQMRYHLEVVNPQGLTVLGIGEDEAPGILSRHFPVIQSLLAERKAATLLHQPAPPQTFEPHVMAVVPLVPSSFYVVLEQSADVALALPLRVRQEIILLTTLGFLAALLVAWVTTRHVVKPTEELMAAAQRMARGDLESPIQVSAQDEVGKLGESLDTMRQKLKAAYGQIEATNRELESQVQERTARLGEVLKKVISVQEEERHRLARELHDEAAQTLGALSIALDRARESLQDTPAQTMEWILEAKAISTRLLEETRRLILDLRPMILDDLGLGSAIRWYAETHLEEQGVEVCVEIDQRPTRLPKHMEVSLFRVIQEALNNIARHASARHAHVRLVIRDSMASAAVADDGAGFDVERVLGPDAPIESVGLLGMQERVRLLNGVLDIRSRQGEGTTLTVEIPIAQEPG